MKQIEQNTMVTV